VVELCELRRPLAHIQDDLSVVSCPEDETNHKAYRCASEQNAQDGD
jgi:hypothetical protein